MFSLITFIVTISIVVVFHEFGHYLACRLYSVRVERFSLGFGKVLLKWVDKRNTEWTISALPLGGYVKPLSMTANAFQANAQKGAQDASHQAIQVAHTIEAQSAFRRFIIYAAGPFFSLLLAAIIYTGLNLKGSAEAVAVIAQPPASSVAAQAGLQAGDRIVGVADAPVLSWNQLRMELMESLTLGEPATIRYITRDDFARISGSGDEQAINANTLNIPMAKTAVISFVKPVGNLENIDLMEEAGLRIKPLHIVAAKVLPNSAAQEAGMRDGDKIIGFCSSNNTSTQNSFKTEDQNNLSLEKLLNAVQSNPGSALCLRIDRAIDGQFLHTQIYVTPKQHLTPQGQIVGQMGVQLSGGYETILIKYGVLASVSKAITKTWDMSWFSIKMIGRIITGDVSWRNLSGPITISDYSGKIAQVGLVQFISFIALISLSIGVLNLLPIPGLDGGQMVLCLLEMVRGKPLSETVLNKVMAVGYSLLLCLFILAFSNDLMRLF